MDYYFGPTKSETTYVRYILPRLIFAILIFLLLYILVDLTIGPQTIEEIKEQTMIVTQKDSNSKTIRLHPIETVEKVIGNLNDTLISCGSDISDLLNSYGSTLNQLDYLLTDQYQEMLGSIEIGDTVKVEVKERTSTLLGMKTYEDTELLSLQGDK